VSKDHTLSAFEEYFLEDGKIAVCACGWKSRRHITEGNAILEHSRHVAGTFCGACGCQFDEDGCGCNPEGA
jgi:hypothetical protein